MVKKDLKNSVIYMVGTIIMGLLGFASSMILTRVVSKQVYAMYGLLTTFVTALVMLMSFGYDSSYMRFYYDNGYDHKKYLWMCIKYPLILFIIVSILLLEPNQFIIKIIFENELSSGCISVLIIYLLFSIIQRFLQLSARMEGYAFNYITANIISKSGFLLIILLIFYFYGNPTFFHVILSFLISITVATFLNVKVFYKIKNKKNEDGTIVQNGDLLKYGLPFMINSVAVLIIPVIEKIVIRNLAGWSILSIYTAAAIFQTVITLLSNTIDNIWNPIVFKYCDLKEKFKPLLHDFGMLITFITTFGLSLCILLRRWLVLFLDSSYFDVYIIAPVILYSSCLTLVASIYSVGINICKKTVHYIVIPIIQLVLSLLMCYIFIPTYGLIGIGISVIVSISVSRFYRILVGLKLYDTGEKEFNSIILWVICIAVSILAMFFTSFSSDLLWFVLINFSLLIVYRKNLKDIFNLLISLL